MRTMRSAARLWVTVSAIATLALAGCGGGDSSGYDSPILNEDVPTMDIRNLPDIDVAHAQMMDLIEQVRTEVSRLVPASAPWTWRHKDSWGGCNKNGSRGVSLYLAKLTSPHSFTDEEWALVLPALSAWPLKRA